MPSNEPTKRSFDFLAPTRYKLRMMPPSQGAPDDWVEIGPIGDVLVRAAAAVAGKEAIVFPDERRTYSESSPPGALRPLAARARVRAGDRVGILMPNCFDFLETQLACALLGVSAVPINMRFRALELGYVLEDSDMVAIATNDLIGSTSTSAWSPRPRRSASVPPAPDRARRELARPGSSAAARSSRPARACRPRCTTARRRVRLRDEAMMMYTSGTTTNPKGCVLTHEALVRTGVAAAERWELVHDERFWNPLPMFHMGQVFPLLAHMHVGATLVTSSYFDAAEALQLIEAERITFAYPTFPAITQDLIHHPDFEPRTSARSAS